MTDSATMPRRMNMASLLPFVLSKATPNNDALPPMPALPKGFHHTTGGCASYGAYCMAQRGGRGLHKPRKRTKGMR